MTPEQLAQIAYEAYCNVSWRTLTWDHLESYQQDAWIAAAKAVKANVLSGFTKVGEGE